VYLAISSCICCIPLYLIVSHLLENGIWPKIHSRGGLKCQRIEIRESVSIWPLHDIGIPIPIICVEWPNRGLGKKKL